MRSLLALGAVVAVAAGAGSGGAAPPDRCAPGAVGARLGSMVAGLNGGRGDRFAGGFARDGRWQPYTRTVAPPGVVGRRKITYLAILSIGAEVEWALSQLRRTTRDRYTVTVAVRAHEQPAGRGSTKLRVDCASGLIQSWVGPALKHPLPVDDD
jgi:hypothetical protein